MSQGIQRVIVFIAVSLCIAQRNAGGADEAVSQSPQWQEIELAFTAARDTANPYTDVEAWVDFTHDDGETIRRPAFWDGGRTFRVRFASTQSSGMWRWSASDRDGDTAFGGRSGTLQAVATTTDENTIFARHGFWKIPTGGRNLIHADGTPRLLCADTAWALPWRATVEQVETYARDRRAKGFNAALMMTVQPDMRVTGPRSRTEDRGFDVGFEDLPNGTLRKLNPGYFQKFDRLVDVLTAHGIAPVYQPVFHGYGWKGGGTAGNVVSAEDYARYCRYLVARYGARPAIWLVGGDGPANQLAIVEQLDRAGRAIEEWDAYQQPTGIHYSPHALNRTHQDKDWLDFQWCQTGHNGEHVAERVADMWRNLPIKAVANGEPTYENIGGVGRGAGWWQGHEAWCNLTGGGTMGLVYGAGSLWQWRLHANEPDHADWCTAPGAGWREALDFDGSNYPGIAAQIFDGLPLAGMKPNWDCTYGRRGLLVPGKLFVLYLPDGGGTGILSLEVPRAFRVFDPKTGKVVGQGRLSDQVPAQVSSGSASEPRVIVFTAAADEKRPVEHVRNGGRVREGEAPAEPIHIVWPSPDWQDAQPAEVGLNSTQLEQAKKYALSAGGSGMIVRRGKAVMRWGDQRKRYDIKSATKSFGATMLGVAIKDGKIELETPARRYHPTLGVPPASNSNTGWLDEITILHLATQTAGFEKPGGYEKLAFQPGTQWHYSDGGPNWLAECITLQYRRDLEDVMFQRVFTPLSITRDDLRWRKNQYREPEIEGIPRREFGAGIHTNVEALSRLGYLYLHDGRWKNEQILSKEFVRTAGRPIKSVAGLPEWSKARGNASGHYSLLWWNNADGALANVPTNAFWAWGLYDSLIVVIPSLDLVVVRGGARGKQWPRKEGENHYHVLEPFLNPIVAAVNTSRVANEQSGSLDADNAPYPASPVITAIEWASRDSIVRMAKGSDNWPLTWADDDNLYTAYGDGWGFEPRVEKKLSLGLAKLVGGPSDFRGDNIRSESGEQIGQGANGKKASGLLMVDRVLYMWLRNAGNAQLAWSDDHGRNWKRSDWKWTTSFGCPTFLNFGKHYAGARDDYVYIYSHDSDSAYESADRMVMARVPKTRIRDRAAYEFFQEPDDDGNPIWSRDVDLRGAVFSHPGRCYRAGITYNAALKRYLWCQVLPESSHPQGQRFQGGFGIYDAPEPWGPWTTVYFTEDWDVGPGETSSLPTKWMSEDGRTVHLVFSGDDYFSVRKATLTVE